MIRWCFTKKLVRFMNCTGDLFVLRNGKFHVTYPRKVWGGFRRLPAFALLSTGRVVREKTLAPRSIRFPPVDGFSGHIFAYDRTKHESWRNDKRVYRRDPFFTRKNYDFYRLRIDLVCLVRTLKSTREISVFLFILHPHRFLCTPSSRETSRPGRRKL